MSSDAMADLELEPFASTHTVVNSPHQSQSPFESHAAFGHSVHLPPQPPLLCQSVPPGDPNMNSSSKRKRGRPRKYGPEGGLTPPQPQSFSKAAKEIETQTPVVGTATPSLKKARGRPRGSCNKKPKGTSGSGSNGFTPHILNINEGEDVYSKILSISQNGRRAIFVMSASGAISDVTLRQIATSGGTVTYKGQFDILSLSGLFLLSEVDGQKRTTGGLSVALAGSDGRMMGGCVAGALVAASSVQVIMGSFLLDGCSGAKSGAAQVNAGGSNSPSRGTHSESSGGPASPLKVCNNIQLGLP